MSAYARTNDYAIGAAHFVRRRSPLVHISQEDVPAVAAVYYEMTSPAGPMASLYGDEGEGKQGRSHPDRGISPLVLQGPEHHPGTALRNTR